MSFGFSTSKNKNTDNGVKETSAIMSTQVTYEIDHIPLLQDSTISNQAYDACDRTCMPLHMPETLETCKKKHASFH